mmetsp:Transcript_49142/g.113879  ORF Transcript_49142/g.113879 Transcript_49142/m.113879 type:complete len:206 (-) Transcript_49142:190-807(-)
MCWCPAPGAHPASRSSAHRRSSSAGCTAECGADRCSTRTGTPPHPLSLPGAHACVSLGSRRRRPLCNSPRQSRAPGHSPCCRTPCCMAGSPSTNRKAPLRSLPARARCEFVGAPRRRSAWSSLTSQTTLRARNPPDTALGCTPQPAPAEGKGRHGCSASEEPRVPSSPCHRMASLACQQGRHHRILRSTLLATNRRPHSPRCQPA